MAILALALAEPLLLTLNKVAYAEEETGRERAAGSWYPSAASTVRLVRINPTHP